ncbi:MAG: hypothetical protein M0Q96_01175 [Candidatus Omnitrophica bacterium]|jgi:hypothetical protein|nr:hypothetical protein [Candidatus Omnitrophota bacterium]
MNTIVGVIIGAVLTGLSMILNAYFSNRFSATKEERADRRKRYQDYISEIEKFYEDVLHSADRLIRNKGMGREDELEKVYRFEVKFKLSSTKQIAEQFKIILSAIISMADQLPKLPEEFIPKFEDDQQRKNRLEKRKKAEQEREKQAQKLISTPYAEFEKLSKLMKEHLESLRGKSAA